MFIIRLLFVFSFVLVASLWAEENTESTKESNDNAVTEKQKVVTTDKKIESTKEKSLPVKEQSSDNAANSNTTKSDSKATEEIQRQIYNKARKSVVIVKVKSFKSAYVSNNYNWEGTGFIVDKEQGIIATNRHVAGEMSVCTYDIKFSNGRVVPAMLLYYDPIYDFAFLKVETKKVKEQMEQVEFSSSDVDINDEVFMIGNSGGEEFSVYKATIYDIFENVGPFGEQSFKFSGITVGGASGSPVFNKKSEVVGILYGGKFFSGVALPGKYLIDALKYIRDGKKPPRNAIGFIPQYKDVDILEKTGLITEQNASDFRKKFPKANNRALLINTRISGSDADKLIKAGDILWKINGELIGPSLYKLDDIVNNSKENMVEVSVLRDGKETKVKLKTYNLQTDAQDKFISFAGAVFYQMNERTRFASGTHENGVFISGASSNSPFKEIMDNKSFFGEDDRVKITKINGMKINNLVDLENAIKKVIKKKIFTIHMIDYVGGHKFGWVRVEDRKERIGFIKYNEKYSDVPKLFKLNRDKMEWDSKEIHSN